MYKKLQKQINSLSEHSAFKVKNFDELLKENIDLLKITLNDGQYYINESLNKNLSLEETIKNYTFNENKFIWIALESDPYMKKLRVLTLRQIYNQIDKREVVKQLLATTAAGSDLDILGTNENIFRDLGEYPYANFKFTLLEEKEVDTVIPKGLILNSKDDIYKSFLVEDVIILAGNLTGVARVELEKFVIDSPVKTENLITDLTYFVDIEQLETFKHGAIAEDDERYRLRIITAEQYSTAGSESAYIFHSLKSDKRIDDIVVLDEAVLEVNIYLASFTGVDPVMIKRVENALNAKYTRPINDKVIVKSAELINIDIIAEIQLFDLLKQSDIDTNIRENFKDSFFIGQNFIKSDFIRKCHIDGVYKVSTNFNDVLTNEKQIIRINTITLNFAEAQL